MILLIGLLKFIFCFMQYVGAIGNSVYEVPKMSILSKMGIDLSSYCIHYCLYFYVLVPSSYLIEDYGVIDQVSFKM